MSLAETMLAVGLTGVVSLVVATEMVRQNKHMRDMKARVEGTNEELVDTNLSIGSHTKLQDLADLKVTLAVNMACEDAYCAACNFQSCEDFVLSMPKKVGQYRLEGDCLNGLSISVYDRKDRRIEMFNRACQRYGTLRSREIEKCQFERLPREQKTDQKRLEMLARELTTKASGGSWAGRPVCASYLSKR